MNTRIWWPKEQFEQPETILYFRILGGKPLSLISNYPYEVWIDGKFIGDGGYRCIPGEVLIDHCKETAYATNNHAIIDNITGQFNRIQGKS